MTLGPFQFAKTPSVWVYTLANFTTNSVIRPGTHRITVVGLEISSGPDASAARSPGTISRIDASNRLSALPHNPSWNTGLCCESQSVILRGPEGPFPAGAVHGGVSVADIVTSVSARLHCQE
jgi:hypothetical protein